MIHPSRSRSASPASTPKVPSSPAVATRDGAHIAHASVPAPVGQSWELVHEARDQLAQPSPLSGSGYQPRTLTPTEPHPIGVTPGEVKPGESEDAMSPFRPDPIRRTAYTGIWFLNKEAQADALAALVALQHGQPLNSHQSMVLLRHAGDLIKRGEPRKALELMHQLPEGQWLHALADAYDYQGFTAVWNVSLDDLKLADDATVRQLQQMLAEARYMAARIHQVTGERKVDLSRLKFACMRMQVPEDFPLSLERQKVLDGYIQAFTADQQSHPATSVTGSGASASE